MTGSESIDRLLTAEQAAEYLGVSVKTLYALNYAGGLPRFRVGKSVRYRRTELDGWLETRRCG